MRTQTWVTTGILVLFFTLFSSSVISADKNTVKINKQGNAYTITISGLYDFHAVVDYLKVSLFEENWGVRDVHDVDITLRKYGKMLHNKVIRVSKPEYLAETIETSPLSSVLFTQNIVVYQELKSDEPESVGTEPGEIVIAFLDPKARMKAMNIDNLTAIDKATAELTTVLNDTAQFFSEQGTSVSTLSD